MATGHALPPYYLIVAYRFCDKAKNYYMYTPTWVAGSSVRDDCERTWFDCIAANAKHTNGARFQYLFLEDRGGTLTDVAKSVFSEELIKLPSLSSTAKTQKAC